MKEQVNVTLVYLPVINFAFQQNSVSVFRELTIQNLTDYTLNNIQITTLFEPEFGNTVPVSIEFIPAGETVRIDSLKLNLSTNYLGQLTERIAGNINLQVKAGEKTIYQQDYPVHILAYDQWGGISVLPEMLSAFITPNHPAIAPVIKRAALILEQWTGSSALDEYQSRNPDRVRKQMAAVYTAIAEQEIIYSTVPASFEEYGQRVRLVDTILSQKLGTCLDTTLLYATCLEAIGIHPLIVVIRGHAFAGGWLVPETFPDSIINDASLLSKRAADGINELVLVETTCMTMGKGMDFDQAAQTGISRLNEQNFILALDVCRSRFSGIRPIPQRIFDGQHWEIKYDEYKIDNQLLNRPESINPYDLSGISTEIEVTKQLLWERKLLDLSLRNNLLNIRITRNTLQFISADLPAFEDALADGNEFRILNKPVGWNAPQSHYGIYEGIAETDPVISLVKDELTQKRLRSYLTESELETALKQLYRSSRSSLEENGANTLYIGLGLLKWYETASSVRPRYAPILLIPVEIIRKSAAKGYVIRSREEETILNITLLEMLRQNFNINIPGLTPLPEDESGVHVKLVYSIIRNSIKDQPKWDVEEQALLGIFSFNKFTMWNDIHNNASKLAENKVVSSLMKGRVEWVDESEMVCASDLDKQLSPADIVLPVSADSSQLEAVYEAVNDKSFILHGPPGTGKSQTITNLIANALYRNKRVLFVAEKMAALSVVQKRLEAIGLAPFCLEIHSNKTKKSAILSQLKETSEVVRVSSPEDFKREADRILGLRSELNGYIDALHKVYPFGVSLYEAITRYQSIPDREELINIPLAYFSELNRETLFEWQEAIGELVMTANACGHPYAHPLTGIEIYTYSPALKEEIEHEINHTITLLKNISSYLEILVQLFGQPVNSREDMKIVTGIIERLLQIRELTPALLTKPRLGDVLEELEEVCKHGKERDRMLRSIETDFQKEVLCLHAANLLKEWDTASQQWFLPAFFKRKKVKNQLKPYALGNVAKKDIRKLLQEIVQCGEEIKYLDSHATELPALFGRYGCKDQEDWEIIEQIISDTKIINNLILNYSKELSVSSRIKENIAAQLTEGVGIFKSIHGDSLGEINRLFSELTDGEKRLSEKIGISPDILYSDSVGWIDSGTGKLSLWLSNMNKLKDWCQWLIARNRLEVLQIGFVADFYTEKHIETSSLPELFDKSIYKVMIEFILSQESGLNFFKGRIFDEKIAQYKQLQQQFEQLTKKELYARLASNLPSFAREATQNSEVGILQRNIRNNARGTSVRKLFDQIPTLLPRMCPCMLMSPLSVAQYVDANAERFDLVVFDEASQMPTSEAVGVIARANHVVIVGDPKQMPPTSFFSTNTVDEENIEMEDLESILDDCLALSMPSKYLSWHYRSKHESLITFSNTEYYDNKLLTFPSPDNIRSKVRLVPIEGFYDKGHSRQNKAEAGAVVNEIARRLRDEKLRKRSIGVVTFSVVQQSLIDDMLSDLFVKEPELERYALECEEPVFIKNLENVQGDERDVILFSVGYGPDKEGRVSMNFGPLNRIGGERRLNVAVSRSRYEMIIYSTLRADQIDLNRTSSVGVAGLKRFLEYAAKGTLAVANSNLTEESVISIHAIIADKLRLKGYTVHTNIGFSGYKIDIGIVDPDQPSIYRLGIICDGENYKRTKTARDREIVQNSVLKMLGWKICRIWTLEWWENPEGVLTQIEEALQYIDIEEVNEPEEVQPEREEPILTKEYKPVVPSESKNQYKAATLAPVHISYEEFFAPYHQALILQQIHEVITIEAPISRTLLFKKILNAWNITRLGTRLNAYLEELMQKTDFYTSTHDGLLYQWLTKEQCDLYDTYRIESGRDAVDLPPEEVACCLKEILQDEINLPVNDLIRSCAQRFGFSRSGSNLDAAILRGMREAISREYMKLADDRAVVL